MRTTGLVLVVFLAQTKAQTTAGSGFFELSTDERTNSDLREPCERTCSGNSYDFVIVGAGAAGAVLANRLTENPKTTVLLIEAGQSEPAITAVPAFNFNMRKTGIDWDFSTEPDPRYCRGMQDGRCPFPRGKSMGGSTAINNGINSRGNRRDYDHWASLGNSNWDYPSVLPYFKKLESMHIPEYQNDSTYHGFHGPIIVDRTYAPPLRDALIEAGRRRGWPILQDYNAATQIGFPYMQSVIKDGARLSANRAYLHPIRNRKNLYLTKSSLVTKINFKALTVASGVTYEKDGDLHTVKARKEVLLCAGTIQSPQLLMLSGIGPKSHLRQHNISVRADLPVGQNLQDHFGPTGIVFETNITNQAIDIDALLEGWLVNRTGPLTYFGVDMALIDTNSTGNPNGWADIEIISLLTDNNPSILNNVLGYSPETFQDLFPQPSQNQVLWTLAPFLLRPKSRGEILLRDKNPHSKPLIYPNYWSEPEDLQIVIKGVREVLALGQVLPINVTLRTNRPRRCTSQTFMSDDYIECLCRELTTTIYHYVGTCSMGTVVDQNLKVKGITGLRVVDSSVMPTVPTGHTMISTFMVAEKIADAIKSKWYL